MSASERYKWAVERFEAISELSEKLQSSGGLLAVLGRRYQQYAEHIMQHELINSERMRYQHTMVAKTSAHHDDNSHRAGKVPQGR